MTPPAPVRERGSRKCGLAPLVVPVGLVALLVVAACGCGTRGCCSDVEQGPSDRDAAGRLRRRRALLCVGIQFLQVVIAASPARSRRSPGVRVRRLRGFAYSVIGVTLGSAFNFSVAQIVGRPTLERLVGRDRVASSTARSPVPGAGPRCSCCSCCRACRRTCCVMWRVLQHPSVRVHRALESGTLAGPARERADRRGVSRGDYRSLVATAAVMLLAIAGYYWYRRARQRHETNSHERTTTGHGPQDAHAPVSFIPSDTPDAGLRTVSCCAYGWWLSRHAVPSRGRVADQRIGPPAAARADLERLRRIDRRGTVGPQVAGVAVRCGGVAAAFDAEIVAPIRALASRTTIFPLSCSGCCSPAVQARGLRRRIDGTSSDARRFRPCPTLRALSSTPLTFSRSVVAIHEAVFPRLPRRRNPALHGGARPSGRGIVGVSPVSLPARLTFRESDYTAGSGEDLQYPPYTTNVLLTDGGVYDNLGLETTWKRFRTVLVSDAGGRAQPRTRVKGNWISQSIRVEELVHAQVGNLRKRQLIASYRSNERQGAYWGIASDISNYALADALPCP